MSRESIPHLPQFLNMMGRERKATRSTLSAYDADIREFYKFFKDRPLEKGTPQDIQDYLLTQQHLAPSTVARRLSSLRQFYTFLTKAGTIEENPFSFIQPHPYKSRSSPRTSEEDVARLLRGAKTWSGQEGKRLCALLQILFISDIPVSKLVSLPLTACVEALRNKKLFLKLQENDNRDRIVPLTQAALDALREYMMLQNQDSPWLFPSSSQKGHLTRQRFGQLLKELSLKVGLDPQHFSLYTIRRGFDTVN
jgi:integrase/recombinase XerD